jgi:hypothetical protein
MRILVCGSREWTDPEPIRRELRAIPEEFGVTTTQDGYEKHLVGPVIVHGDCRGADRLAGAIAAVMGLPVRVVPADWNRYGPKAGPLRNERMLKEFGPIDLVLAFHEDLPRSKGTKDMIARAVRAGVPVKIISTPRRDGPGARLTRTLQP